MSANAIGYLYKGVHVPHGWRSAFSTIMNGLVERTHPGADRLLVAIRRDDGRWLLHAGDAYFYHGEMRTARRRCTPGLRAYQRLMEVDATSRMTNQERLRALSIERHGEVDVTCTHDPVELERCQSGVPL